MLLSQQGSNGKSVMEVT